MNWFVNNREIIKDLSLDTGTSTSASYVAMCTTSEVNFTTDFNTTDFYVYCDAIQRSLITGVALSLDTTVKLDINNTAIQNLLEKISSMLTTGSVAQFNNVKVKFSLLTGISSTTNTLEYTTYEVPANLVFSDLGGGAEEEGEFGLEIHFNGKATVPTA